LTILGQPEPVRVGSNVRRPPRTLQKQIIARTTSVAILFVDFGADRQELRVVDSGTSQIGDNSYTTDTGDTGIARGDTLAGTLRQSSGATPREDARYGTETTIASWRSRLVCSSCGSRRVDFVVTGTERR
jgi:hypothetical protein